MKRFQRVALQHIARILQQAVNLFYHRRISFKTLKKKYFFLPLSSYEINNYEIILILFYLYLNEFT